MIILTKKLNPFLQSTTNYPKSSLSKLFLPIDNSFFVKINVTHTHTPWPNQLYWLIHIHMYFGFEMFLRLVSSPKYTHPFTFFQKLISYFRTSFFPRRISELLSDSSQKSSAEVLIKAVLNLQINWGISGVFTTHFLPFQVYNTCLCVFKSSISLYKIFKFSLNGTFAFLTKVISRNAFCSSCKYIH